MTGGVVLVLGPTGRNFAAGMSGGVAFVWDPERQLSRRLNAELVDLEEFDAEDERLVVDLVSRHRELTGSQVAGRLVERWGAARSAVGLVAAEFAKVMPRDYRRVLDATRRAIEQGLSVDEAVMAASHG
jgi:glutamate synthase (NADPH/NADH) large chain